MKKSLRFIISAFIVICFAASLLCVRVFASGSFVSASDESLNVGDSLSVTVSVKADEPMHDLEAYVSYNPNVLRFDSGKGASGGSGLVYIDGTPDDATFDTYTLNFTAITAGSSSVWVHDVMYVGEDETSVPDSTLETISVSNTAPSELISPSSNTSPNANSSKSSGDAGLVSVKVSGAKLTPEFNKSVTSYTASVKYSVKKATLSASAVSGATVSGTGTFDLKVGNNNYTITVTAADKKTKKSYTVNIRRMTEEETKQAEENEKNANPLYVTVDGKGFYISPDVSAIGNFEDYSVKTVMRGETEVSYFTDSGSKYKLFYLTDSRGNGSLYNQKVDDVFEKVDYIISGKKLYIVKSFSKNVKLSENHKKTTLKIDNNKYPAVRFTDKSVKDIYILYCYDGKEFGYYRYDDAEKTVSRALEFASTLSLSKAKSKPKFFERFMNMSTAGKIVLSLMLLASIGILLIIVLGILRFVIKKRGYMKEESSFTESSELNDVEIASRDEEF